MPLKTWDLRQTSPLRTSTLTRQHHRAMTASMALPFQSQPDKTGVRPHPLRDGSHDPNLDFQGQLGRQEPRPHDLGTRPLTP